MYDSLAMRTRCRLEFRYVIKGYCVLKISRKYVNILILYIIRAWRPFQMLDQLKTRSSHPIKIQNQTGRVTNCNYKSFKPKSSLGIKYVL